VLDAIRLTRFGLSLEPGNVHGAALDRDVVKPFITRGGASVLAIKDPQSLNRRLAELFAAQPLAGLSPTGTKCPAPPPGFGSASPTPAPSPTP